MVLAGCGNDSTSGDPGGEEGDKTYAVETAHSLLFSSHSADVRQYADLFSCQE
jgi:hypothetical protein